MQQVGARHGKFVDELVGRNDGCHRQKQREQYGRQEQDDAARSELRPRETHSSCDE